MTKRYATRIVIPGATIRFYTISKKRFFFKPSIEESELINLSKSGASFFANELLPFGEKLAMKLDFPDGTVLKLTGSVRWVREDMGRYNVGVLFDPFGKGNGYNSPRALEYLKTIFRTEKVKAKK
jgi:hypothetical protein